MNWSSGRSPLKICPTSNSATSAKPRSPLACTDAIRPGSRLGRMSERSAAIGLASASSLLPPPNNSAAGFVMNDQVTASTMPRAASARLARRVRSWIGVSTGLRGVLAALERRHRHLVDADDAHDLLDDVGLALHVGAPGRDRDLHDRAVAGHHEAEPVEDAAHLRQRHLDAGEPLHLGQREIDHAVVAIGVADHDILRRRAAAELHHHARRHLEPGHHEGRIDAALEAIARVRIDAELAAGLRDVDLVPQRRIRSARRWCSRRSPRLRRP